MSLRRRLAVVLLLGLSALVIAVVAIVHVIASGDASRERAAQANADAGAQAIADALAGRVDPSTIADPDPEERRALKEVAASVLRPVANAAGGFCTAGGAIVVTAGKVGPGRDKLDGLPFREVRPLPPDAQEAVEAACRRARPGDPGHARVEHPRELELVSAVTAGKQGAAWYIARARTRASEDGPAWPYEVVLLAVAVVALAAVTIDAIVALGRGAGELRSALLHVEKDLRARVPVPRARELAEIASGLQAMAAHLADARDRERALEAALARGERLSALGRVAAGIAHEVRNPLAGMKLRLDLLDRSGGLDAAAREDVAACLGEIARLDRLVQSLLSVSRRKTLVHEEIDLAAFVDQRIAYAAPVAAKAGARAERAGGATVSADPDTLAAAIDNLLRNAIEASPPGGRVLLRIGDDAGAVALDVEDEGSGIPEGRSAELFEPFFTTKAEGTGLGLWISRLLLEAMGASLRYERVGERTRMRITFPERREAPGG